MVTQQIQDVKVSGVGVIKWEDDSDFDDLLETSKEFEELLSHAENQVNVKEGSIVTGTVSRVSDDGIFIDIGLKMEGEVPREEFKDLDGKITVKAGDQVEVYLDRFENNHGNLVLSRERAEMLRAWDRFSKAFENGEIVEGIIMSRVKGGLAVDIGVKAFLPGSQIDLRPVKNLDKLIGEKLQFKIIKFNKKRGNVVLSRRVLLEQDRDKLRATTLENLKEGAILKGVVKNITDYGAFIDLGGIDGLLHITDMSWGRINHPSQIFDVGMEIEVKVLSYDEQKRRVSLGYKQLQIDPWKEAAAKYVPNTIVKGKVVSLTDYGAFVELESGIEGLIHISEMTWSKRIKHPSKIVNVGDEIDVMILGINEEDRKISLGMKQIEPNPWEIVKEKYHVSDVIRGTIRNITDFGIFIGIEEGIDGLIHISDISWTERIKHPGDIYKKGDEIEAKILQIDTEGEKFSLGIKQLTPDPFIEAMSKFAAGTQASGKVTKIADFGVFVELMSGVEGMVHVSELDVNEVKNPSEIVKEGDSIEFIVLATDSEERKFNLSRRALLKKLEGDDLKNYIKTAVETKTSFAEAFSRAKGSKDDPSSED